MTLRVLTLNIWNRSGPYQQRAIVIRSIVEQLAPDVIAFQEALSSERGDQATELLAGLGYQAVFGASGPFWEDPDETIGNVVASRHPILEQRVTALPTAEPIGRVAVSARIDAPWGAFWATSTHLDWRPDHGASRERQVVALADLLQELSDADGFPPVVAGDFNAPPDATEIRFLTGRHALDGRSTYLQDAWAIAGDGGPGLTWSARNPFAGTLLEERRVDYVFVGIPQTDGCGLVERCSLVGDAPVGGVWVSDHAGVHADIRTTPVRGPSERARPAQPSAS